MNDQAERVERFPDYFDNQAVQEQYNHLFEVICGCGCPEGASWLLYRILKGRQRETLERLGAGAPHLAEIEAWVAEDPDAATHVILYLLDELRLMEHGTSVPGWTLPRGDRFVEAYEAVSRALARGHE